MPMPAWAMPAWAGDATDQGIAAGSQIKGHPAVGSGAQGAEAPERVPGRRTLAVSRSEVGR